jgi:hypothetical protein
MLTRGPDACRTDFQYPAGHADHSITITKTSSEHSFH